jgi:hypothetical protein
MTFYDYVASLYEEDYTEDQLAFVQECDEAGIDMVHCDERPIYDGPAILARDHAHLLSVIRDMTVPLTWEKRDSDAGMYVVYPG